MLVKQGVLKMLILYKKYLSRGNHCRMIPSCSEYTYGAVKKYGVIKGVFLGARRIVSCHPWGKSGTDSL
jgi:putative membrane protein insertion efficiency factor